MNETIIKEIANNLNIKTKQVEVVLSLLSEGNTIPFIARYRKEATGALDEEEIRKITKACNLTDKCFDYLKTFIKKGMTEKEIADEIERYFKKNGADGLSFETIVASRTKFI